MYLVVLSVLVRHDDLFWLVCLFFELKDDSRSVSWNFLGMLETKKGSKIPEMLVKGGFCSVSC